MRTSARAHYLSLSISTTESTNHAKKQLITLFKPAISVLPSVKLSIPSSAARILTNLLNCTDKVKLRYLLHYSPIINMRKNKNIYLYIYLINRVRGLYWENIGPPGLGSTDRAALYERSSKQTALNTIRARLRVNV